MAPIGRCNPSLVCGTRNEAAAIRDERDGLAAKIKAEIENELAARRAELEDRVRQTEVLRKTRADLETEIVAAKEQLDTLRKQTGKPELIAAGKKFLEGL